MTSIKKARTELFTQVALVQLKTRQAGVLRGSASGEVVVCPAFLNDVAIITEAILKDAEQFAAKGVTTKMPKAEPKHLVEARESFKSAVEDFVENNAELLESLKD